jgi:hypothetical protein
VATSLGLECRNLSDFLLELPLPGASLELFRCNLRNGDQRASEVLASLFMSTIIPLLHSFLPFAANAALERQCINYFRFNSVLKLSCCTLMY